MILNFVSKDQNEQKLQHLMHTVVSIHIFFEAYTCYYSTP